MVALWLYGLDQKHGSCTAGFGGPLVADGGSCREPSHVHMAEGGTRGEAALTSCLATVGTWGWARPQPVSPPCDRKGGRDHPTHVAEGGNERRSGSLTSCLATIGIMGFFFLWIVTQATQSGGVSKTREAMTTQSVPDRIKRIAAAQLVSEAPKQTDRGGYREPPELAEGGKRFLGNKGRSGARGNHRKTCTGREADRVPAHKQRGAAWPQGLKPATRSLSEA